LLLILLALPALAAAPLNNGGFLSDDFVEVLKSAKPGNDRAELPHCAEDIVRFCRNAPACRSLPADAYRCLSTARGDLGKQWASKTQVSRACRRDLSAEWERSLAAGEAEKGADFSPERSAPPPERFEEACRADAEKLCPAANLTGQQNGDALACLLDHQDALSPTCRAAALTGRIRRAFGLPSSCNFDCVCPGVARFDEGVANRWSAALTRCMDTHLQSSDPLPPGCREDWTGAKVTHAR
jgi:hypothetical protein